MSGYQPVPLPGKSASYQPRSGRSTAQSVRVEEKGGEGSSRDRDATVGLGRERSDREALLPKKVYSKYHNEDLVDRDPKRSRGTRDHHTAHIDDRCKESRQLNVGIGQLRHLPPAKVSTSTRSTYSSGSNTTTNNGQMAVPQAPLAPRAMRAQNKPPNRPVTGARRPEGPGPSSFRGTSRLAPHHPSLPPKQQPAVTGLSPSFPTITTLYPSFAEPRSIRCVGLPRFNITVPVKHLVAPFTDESRHKRVWVHSDLDPRHTVAGFVNTDQNNNTLSASYGDLMWGEMTGDFMSANANRLAAYQESTEDWFWMALDDWLNANVLQAQIGDHLGITGRLDKGRGIKPSVHDLGTCVEAWVNEKVEEKMAETGLDSAHARQLAIHPLVMPVLDEILPSLVRWISNQERDRKRAYTFNRFHFETTSWETETDFLRWTRKIKGADVTLWNHTQSIGKRLHFTEIIGQGVTGTVWLYWAEIDDEKVGLGASGVSAEQAREGSAYNVLQKWNMVETEQGGGKYQRSQR